MAGQLESNVSATFRRSRVPCNLQSSLLGRAIQAILLRFYAIEFLCVKHTFAERNSTPARSNGGKIRFDLVRSAFHLDFTSERMANLLTMVDRIFVKRVW
jgi:hypothetical protein